VSDAGSGQAVPIQLIATSQGVLAIPQNYKLIAQNAATTTARGSTVAAAVASSSPTKRRLSAATSASGGLLKVAKIQTSATTSQVTSDTNSSAVVANSLPHTVGEAGLIDSASLASNQSAVQAAVRDSYEKLFWKVYLQSSSFQSMPRPSVEGFNGGTEVRLERETTKCQTVL